MCLLLFYINPNASDDELYLILVNVRDEMYNRPTALAKFWEPHPEVIGGMDLEPGKEGGTWLAMSKRGKIGVLLNILQPDEELLAGKKGRGFLVANYVMGGKGSLEYLKELHAEGSSYNEFLLIAMDYSSRLEPKLAYYTNSSDSPPVSLEPGIYAYGNSISLDYPWPKVCKAKDKFSEIVKKHSSVTLKNNLVDELFSLLLDDTKYPIDENMKKQGKDKSRAFLEKLSAVFVRIPEANYGSRCHTVILVDGCGNVDYYERSRPEKMSPVSSNQWISNHRSFKLQSQSSFVMRSEI